MDTNIINVEKEDIESTRHFFSATIMFSVKIKYFKSSLCSQNIENEKHYMARYTQFQRSSIEH